ncbi:MAG TPA: DUF6352 family protein [Usitatibacter sp.]|nr:DUF6352 family protein [Usitatibacter sp.]
MRPGPVAQDFWASSGYRLLDRRPEGLRASPAWLALFLDREELAPPAEAGPRERALHSRLRADPAAAVPPEAVAGVEDADARENWSEFLRFRERVLSFPTLEACYLDLFRRPAVDLAPAFVDALAQAIVRDLLEGTEDPWLCRAGEMLFRRQRVSTAEGKVLAADAATIEVFAETGGFGSVGRLLRQQNTPTPAVKMDVLGHENAALYFMRDELYGFVLDLSPSGPGAAALARVLERWVARLAGVGVTIEPLPRIDDDRWRWHVGLDVDSTAILNSLYRGEAVKDDDLARLVLLFRMDFHDERDLLPQVAGKPVYLGLACRPDRSLKVKPQNLVINLPLPRAN